MPLTLLQQHTQKNFFFIFFMMLYTSGFFHIYILLTFENFYAKNVTKKHPLSFHVQEDRFFFECRKKYEKLGERDKLWHKESAGCMFLSRYIFLGNNFIPYKYILSNAYIRHIWLIIFFS